MSKIILPLDNLTWKETLPILKATKNLVWGYKIRRSIFENGLSVIQDIREYGNVMIDFKFYDIPSAINEAVNLFIDNGANIITIHMSSDYKPKPHQSKFAAAITILTSMTVNSFSKYYKEHNELSNLHIPLMVKNMVSNACDFNYEYIVCSGKELIDITNFKIKKICPGIRPVWYQDDDDQSRTTTPEEAISLGADLLVIGRPLLNSKDIDHAINQTNDEIERGE